MNYNKKLWPQLVSGGPLCPQGNLQPGIRGLQSQHWHLSGIVFPGDPSPPWQRSGLIPADPSGSWGIPAPREGVRPGHSLEQLWSPRGSPRRSSDTLSVGVGWRRWNGAPGTLTGAFRAWILVLLERPRERHQQGLRGPGWMEGPFPTPLQ